MRFGAVIGVCTDRGEAQRRALESIAVYSLPSTHLIVVFNGVAPFAVDPRYEIIHEAQRIGREQGVWRWAYDFAVNRGWDWCGTFHDDFYLDGGGWERYLRRIARTHQIGVASWAAYTHTHAVHQPDGSYSLVTGIPSGVPDPLPGFLAVTVDGCGMAFNMELFRPRGRFTPLAALSGYGEAEAGFYALRQGWGCAKVMLPSHHHPEGTSNTRGVLGIPIEGVTETVKAYLDALPATVLDADRIRTGPKVLNVRRPPPSIIPALQPSYDADEEQAAAAVLRRRWTGSGPEVEAFEAEFAAWLGVEAWQVVGVGSCTAALHLAVRLTNADVALVPAITFVSTASAAVEAGATQLVFVDVDNALLMDMGAVQAASLQTTKAVLILVHMAGVPVDTAPLWALAAAHGITVIEDCAHAAGTARNGRSVGVDPRSRFSCWSFNAVKNIGAGDGGAVVCHDQDDAARLRALRWCGIDKDTFARTGQKGYAWQYDITDVSLKHQMSELNAAVGRVQLRKLPAMNTRRQTVADTYRQEFAGLGWLECPAPPAVDVAHSNHLFIVRVPAEARGRFVEDLRLAGIGTSVHYKPLNLHGPYKDCMGPTPNAHAVWPRLVSLPMHAGLTDDDVERVVDAVTGFKP